VTKPPLILAAPIVLMLTGPLAAQTLNLPAGAVQIGSRTESPARYAMPTAAFDGSKVPSQTVTGTLDQTAWRLDGRDDNTLSLLRPLADQLTAQGFRTLFTCQTTECGGFDFRFAIDVLPEPAMHVDLGDFQYLAAMNSAGDATTLLVSRTADQGFVQITSVIASGAVSAQPRTSPSGVVPPHTSAPVPQASQSQVPTSVPKALSGFEETLLTTGSVPLDDLVFESGKANLEPGTYASLAALAEWLKANPTVAVTLVGHTDASGSLAANVTLSRQRAAAVRDWLIKTYDASAGRIDAQGAGYLSPRASNQTQEGRARNRRVEVMLTSTAPN